MISPGNAGHFPRRCRSARGRSGHWYRAPAPRRAVPPGSKRPSTRRILASSSISSRLLCAAPPGGVDDQHVGADPRRFLHRVKDDAGRVAASALADQRHAEPFGPDAELGDGGSAEECRQRRHPHSPVPGTDGRFGDGGGLAAAVDPRSPAAPAGAEAVTSSGGRRAEDLGDFARDGLIASSLAPRLEAFFGQAAICRIRSAARGPRSERISPSSSASGWSRSSRVAPATSRYSRSAAPRSCGNPEDPRGPAELPSLIPAFLPRSAVVSQ